MAGVEGSIRGATAVEDDRRPLARGDAAGLLAVEDPVLFGRVASGDVDARDALFERYRGFASMLARRFRHPGIAREDLEQVAAIGLVEAIARFDPDRHVRFTTFAARTVEGELKRFLRDRGWSVRVPRGLQDSTFEVRRAEATLAQRLGRAPTQGELALETDLDTAAVGDALLARCSFDAVSIDAPGFGAERDPAPSDRLPSADHRLEIVPEWADLAEAARSLTERDRRILRLRFFDDLSQSEIAGRIGVSQMHVSRLLSRALATLRGRMEERPEPDPGELRNAAPWSARAAGTVRASGRGRVD